MMSFRKIIFWCHLTVAATVGAIVVVMCATGALLTYQRQLTTWADTRDLAAGPPAAGVERLSIESLLRRIETEQQAAPTAVTLRAHPDAPIEVSLGRDRRVFVNAYTGAVLGDGAARMRGFFRSVTAWHRSLGATGERRALGRAITGVANIGFLFIIVSGFYLWWPRRWTTAGLRNAITFRRRLSGKARDFNWHNAIGVWSTVPLFVVVASGVVIAYPWASALVYRAAGEAPPARGAAAVPTTAAQRASAQPAPRRAGAAYDGLDMLLPRARARVPKWRTISVQLPREHAPTVTFALDAGTGGQPHKRAQLTLARDGRVVKWEPFDAQSTGRQWRSMLRFAHTGEVLGITGQTIAGLASLAVVVLAWTGLALAFRRFRHWRRRAADQRGLYRSASAT
jgi:uncharacterized iron-regulated membrane protein